MSHHPGAPRRALLCPVLALIALTSPACRTQAPPPQPDGPPPAPAPAGPRDLGGGLLIEDLRPGHGEPCPDGASVTMNFIASLAGGHVYDSSAERRQPLSFSLSSPGLIQGLRAGIPGMKRGGTRRIHIPWTLGYGAAGRDPVPPRTDLVFEIDLLDWTPADPANRQRPAGAARPRP